MKEVKIGPDGLQMLHDYIESLEAENKLLRKEQERLEWLIENVEWEPYVKPKRDHKDWRLDIDEAMRES